MVSVKTESFKIGGDILLRQRSTRIKVAKDLTLDSRVGLQAACVEVAKLKSTSENGVVVEVLPDLLQFRGVDFQCVVIIQVGPERLRFSRRLIGGLNDE